MKIFFLREFKIDSGITLFYAAKNIKYEYLVEYNNNTTEESQLIEYLLESIEFLNKFAEKYYLIYIILGIACQLNIYDKIKTILTMLGFSTICAECKHVY